MTVQSPESSTAPTLKIQTMGHFVIWLGSARLPDSAWGRDKARRLFQYFITHRQRHTAKERIVADLWPALNSERADRDFKVALNALQTTLEPDRPARAPSAIIARQGSSYGLQPDAPLLIDVVEFDAGIAAGSAAESHYRSQAIELYRQALQRYQGEYLPDAIYEDWSSAERERLAAIYLTGATRLARLLVNEGTTVEAVIWCQKVIAVDPCWEEAYRLLMQIHMKSGNRPLAIRAYEQCRRSLADELAIEPMAETTSLYERVKAGEPI